MGNGSDDATLSGNVAGQFYFNTSSLALNFDADGDGKTDHAIGVKIAAMAASSFML